MKIYVFSCGLKPTKQFLLWGTLYVWKIKKYFLLYFLVCTHIEYISIIANKLSKTVIISMKYKGTTFTYIQRFTDLDFIYVQNLLMWHSIYS